MQLWFVIVGFVVAIVGYKLIFKKTKNKNQWNEDTTSDEAANGMDLRGKLAIITGGNKGLGKETTRILLKHGCTVVMGCRNQETAIKTYNELSELIKNNKYKNKLFNIKLDLSSLNSIKSFVNSFYKIKELESLKNTYFIHYLINNAGIMTLPKYNSTSEGIEKQFGVNHIGHFYLTNLLLKNNNKFNNDLLNSRIINLSSSGHWFAPYKFTSWINRKYKLNIGPTKKGYRPWIYYGISKASNLIFGRELNNRFKHVISVSVHPGIIGQTNLWQNSKFMAVFIPLFETFFGEMARKKNIKTGTATTIRCIAMNDNEIISGGYYADCNIAKPRWDMKPNNKSDKLFWEYSVNLIKKKGFEF